MAGNPPNPKFEDLLTDRMRTHLGVSHRQNRPGGAFGIQKRPQRSWTSDRPVQVETAFINGPQPDTHHNRRDEAEQAARAERLAREQLERQLREKEAARIALETRLGHEAMARREAEAARREAEAKVAAAVSASQAVPAPSASSSPLPPSAPPKPPKPAERVKRAYIRRESRAPLYDHPKRPLGRMPGYLPNSQTFDYRKFPSTETRWVFITPAAAAEPAPKPAPPPPPPPPPSPTPTPQEPLPPPPAAKAKRAQQRAVAWWKPGWREKLYG